MGIEVIPGNIRWRIGKPSVCPGQWDWVEATEIVELSNLLSVRYTHPIRRHWSHADLQRVM